MPRVSVLSAVRNESKHIVEMINSIRHQNMSDWELIIVDDGSSDSTVASARQARQDDERIAIIDESRKIGKVAAFNRAYAESCGDVVVLLAGDDTLPADSLSVRADALEGLAGPSVGFFKLRTFSDNPKFNGAILPRGRGGNRSGGTLVLNRKLADTVFPIDAELISEDLWIQHAAVGSASSIIESTRVVLNYRIHPGNSNPRGLPYRQMTESIHLRQLAYRTLLSSARLHLNSTTRSRLEALATAEELRYQGRSVRLLLQGDLPLIDRLGFAAMSNPVLYLLRTRFYLLLSGLRRG